jgi:hypothetical protein
MKKIAVEEERRIIVEGVDRLKAKHPVHYTDHTINITNVHCRKYDVIQSLV